MTGTQDIILERRGTAAIIRLNRPRALNSLTLGMVKEIHRALEQFAEDPGIACAILAGAGERGLCAGGDVRAIHDQGRAKDPEATRFWREEFPLNHYIAHYPKPYIALMDGITMGGGVGLASHGRCRAVTERTRLAMPETGIGYFPDVGATWLLPKAPGEIGTWLGLTGSEIGAADAIYARLADFCIASNALEDLTSALGELPMASGEEAFAATISRFAEAPPDGVLLANQALINRTFAYDTVDDILVALRNDGCAFAIETADLIMKRSPTSLKLTLRLLRLGRTSSSLLECLEREFAAAVKILDGHDFYEGVRAALVDKDRNPKWSPDRLNQITEADIDAYLDGQNPPLFPEHRL